MNTQVSDSYTTDYGQGGSQPGYGQPGHPTGPLVSGTYGTNYGKGDAHPGYGQSGQPPPPPPGPVVAQWMHVPPPISGCPEGLEYLTQVDQLVVKQQIEIIELVTGFEMPNKYKVFNNLGQQVYFAAEESGFCMRYCCGPSRGFVIHILDNNQQEVLTFIREFKCCAGCCWCANSMCCAFVLRVEWRGELLGYVKQEQSCWKPHYGLYTPDDRMVARIRGPCCVCSSPCCGDVEFPVMSPNDTEQIGRIAKQWTGIVTEWLTDADTFCVTFPMNMDVKMKAVMFGALFLIDFMYFERSQNRNY